MAAVMLLTGGYAAFAMDGTAPLSLLQVEAPGQETAPYIKTVPSIPKDAIVPETDFTITADEITPESAKLSWNASEICMSYSLYSYNYITLRWEELLTTSRPFAQLSGLTEDTDYRIVVLNSANDCIFGEIRFTTGVKSSHISVKHVASDSIELRIRHSASVSKVYLYKSTDGEHFEKLGRVKGTSFTDTDVKEETEYFYKVKGINRRRGKVNKSRFSRTVSAFTMKSFGLPAVSGTTKTYAYYTAVTVRSSPQYQLLNSAECYTDEETGIRMVDGFYCAALGSYYGTRVGNKYRLTLKDGDELKEINIILCDQKANVHTDANHQYAVLNRDIVEFYIERSRLPHGIVGDYNNLKQFRGDIVKIEQYIEKEDSV